MPPNDSATRPSSVSSSFYDCLQHLHVLDHWAKLFREAPTASFIIFFVLFLQGLAYWKKGRSLSFRRITKGSSRCSCFSFFVLFSLFVPFCA
ncbi:hypothetical protein H5410_061895 [Solanum commersonii]|uniref:Transmembrane protein n=1 Tax=Solanum commersonii TaxID=4109 RepID=A0A9J5W990_SOLCO|nr:hypothetical protein H5410_061895 [Solanum commersonii]